MMPAMPYTASPPYVASTPESVNRKQLTTHQLFTIKELLYGDPQLHNGKKTIRLNNTAMDQGIELLMPTVLIVPANAPFVDNSPLCRSMTNTCEEDPLMALNLKLVEPSSRVNCVCKLSPPILTLGRDRVFLRDPSGRWAQFASNGANKRQAFPRLQFQLWQPPLYGSRPYSDPDSTLVVAN
jgi:hypothetical protein